MAEKDNNSQVQKRKIPYSTILCICAIWVLAIVLIWPVSHVHKRDSDRHKDWEIFQCGHRLYGLGKAVQLYARGSGGKYPTTDKWCDLLLQWDFVTERSFVCPRAVSLGDNARCHYAINPDAKPDSSPDTVLLFTAKGGWNQFGGLEALSTKHSGRWGCWVLFVDGGVKSVKTEELGTLKWK